jgi:N-acetylglucosaminyldiphosphoundecaprenol N-acetyl-beta-D-mannosaminyltransferase
VAAIARGGPRAINARLTGRDRVDILGCGVDLVDAAGALECIMGFVRDGRSAQVVTLGAEMAIRAVREPAYRDAVNGADLVVADSVGVVWASSVLGRPLRERVAGIELVERLCDAADFPFYFLGAAEGVAEAAASQLSSRHPRLRVVGARHGYFDDNESPPIAEAIRASGARAVLVALGVPRQEFWIRENLARLGKVTCIGVGGAFDVWAGKVARAPDTWRRAGLEWLYRLGREPRRIGRQLALPEFALRVLLQRLGF